MDLLLKPFAWLLLFFYEALGNYGLALILFAILIKTVLFPVTLKGKKSMIKTNLLSGRMQQLKKQYGKDRERYNAEVQKLYAKEQVNPAGGCLWSMIPMLILLGLYYIIRQPLTMMMGVPGDMIETVANITGIANTGAFPQIAMAQALNSAAVLEQVKAALGEAGAGVFALDFTFLGINLASIPNWKIWEDGLRWATIGLFLLPLISTVVSFFSMKITMATNKVNNNVQEQSEAMERTNKSMMYSMPLVSLFIGFTMPAGLCVYWIAQYVVTMIQEIICGKLLKKDYEAARQAALEREKEEKEAEKLRRAEAAAERARRIEEEKKNRGKQKPGNKKPDPETPDIRKADSREGMRTYARGRAYLPDRFGGVTPYRGGETAPEETASPAPAEEPVELDTAIVTELREQDAPVFVEEAAADAAPTPEEFIEIEVEEDLLDLQQDEADQHEDKEGI